MAKKKLHYVSNDELLGCINEYRLTNDPVLWNRIGRMIIKIAQRILTLSCFVGYPQDLKDEMLSNGCYNCILRFHKFDDEISKNPFSYFSQIIFNAYKHVLNVREKHEESSISIDYFFELDDGSIKIEDWET